MLHDFVDAGNTYPRLGELSLSDLEYGAGLGLRIGTPFGLARIDYGLPLTDRSWYPFFEKLVELDVPAMIHVSGSCNENFHATGAHYINADTTACSLPGGQLA